MMLDELVILLLISLLMRYWYDAMRAREAARYASIQACKDSDVSFLDDTVSLKKLRLKKNKYGQLSVYREYQFDFSSDGYSRYQGSIIMYGKYVSNIDLGVFRV